MNELNICYTVDNNLNYIKMMGVSIFSLIKNKNPNTKLNIYILHKDIPQDLQEKISSMANTGATISFIAIKPEDEPQLGNISNSVYRNNGVLYRLLIPKFFPHLNRMLYLDCDTLIRKDLAELYNQNFEDNYICTLKVNLHLHPCSPKYINYQGKIYHQNDYYSKILDLPLEYFEKNKKSYLNSGVILFNIAKIIENSLDKVLLTNVIKYHDSLLMPDQDILIKTFGLGMKDCTNLYNFFVSPRAYNKEHNSKAYIYHYIYPKAINPQKWHKTHLLKEYLQYLQQSPFKLPTLIFNFYYYKALLTKFRVYLYKDFFRKTLKLRQK